MTSRFPVAVSVFAVASAVSSCAVGRLPNSHRPVDSATNARYSGKPEAAKEPPLETAPWLGCYDVTVDRADKHLNLGRLRLTDHLEPATAGTYTVETVKEGEHGMTMMGWWPMSPTSIHLGLGDGYTGWGGELEQTSVGLQGSAAWSADTGQKNGGWILRASPATCNP